MNAPKGNPPHFRYGVALGAWLLHVDLHWTRVSEDKTWSWAFTGDPEERASWSEGAHWALVAGIADIPVTCPTCGGCFWQRPVWQHAG